jgi:hypothetical protein
MIRVNDHIDGSTPGIKIFVAGVRLYMEAYICGLFCYVTLVDNNPSESVVQLEGVSEMSTHNSLRWRSILLEFGWMVSAQAYVFKEIFNVLALAQVWRAAL